MTNLVDLAARLQSRRRGASLVELLVCLAIIATMITLLFPAIQSVRAGMKRAECGDHKRQLSPPAGAAADEGLRFLLLSRRTGHHRRLAGLGRGGPQCAWGA